MIKLKFCIFMSVLLMVADGFTVYGPSAPLSARLGSSVVLPCYVDEALPVEDLEVQWRRADSEILIHLYQDGDSRPEVQQQDYRDRPHFFTEEIQHGNFSLRLDNLTAQDEGEYTCKVLSQQDFGETVAEIKYVQRLLVSGSNRPASAYVGEDVTLNCSVVFRTTPEHIEEVSWLKTDKDGDILVLLYQNNKTLPDSLHERFRGRVEFFTAEIPKGNFSFRLKSVRTEDKGVYVCRAFAGNFSANATVALERLGFFSLHIAVLFFCVAAGSGAFLLLCCLIYCRLSRASSSTIWNLQLSLGLFPNISMFIAFILWGFIEGSLHETITCSSLYILRPFMLIWALSCLRYRKERLKSWISFFTTTREFAVFTLVVYSVLFSYVWKKRAHETDIKPRALSGLFFAFVVLMCLTLNFVRFPCREQQGERIQTPGFKNMCCRPFIIFFLVLFEFSQLFFSFGLDSRGALVYIVAVFVYMVWLAGMSCIFLLIARSFCKIWIAVSVIITLLVVNIIVVIFVHNAILQRETERLEWICVISFLEVLKIVVIFVQANETLGNLKQTDTSQEESKTLFLCNEIMYMFGVVGVVLLSSVSLTAELILKALNGERVFGDLRVIVFPSESAFVLYCLILQMHIFWTSLPPEPTGDYGGSSPSYEHEPPSMHPGDWGVPMQDF